MNQDNTQPKDMTVEEFYSGFNLDFLSEEERQTIYTATELYAEGKLRQKEEPIPVEGDSKMKKVDTQFATSMTADFDESTWTFLMPDKSQVWAGQFAIVDRQVYDEMIERLKQLSSPPPQSIDIETAAKEYSRGIKDIGMLMKRVVIEQAFIAGHNYKP